jgi:hypothetical protein
MYITHAIITTHAACMACSCCSGVSIIPNCARIDIIGAGGVTSPATIVKTEYSSHIMNARALPNLSAIKIFFYFYLHLIFLRLYFT